MKTIVSMGLGLFLLASFSFGQGKKPNLNSEQFMRKLNESYNAVSTREPLATEIEVALLQRIRVMISENPTQAKNMLVDILSGGTPVSAAFNHAMGNIYYTTGEYLNAEIEYNAAIEKHASFQRAWNGLGMARFRQDNYEGALDALTTSVKLGANDAESYGILGFCHLRLGNLKSAEVAYDLAILSNPDNSEWAEGLAEIYMETDRYDEARRVFEQLSREFPDDAEYWLLQSNTWLLTDEPLKAARCLEIADRIERLDAKALFLLGSIYLKEEIFEQAEQAYLRSMNQGMASDETKSLEALSYLTSRGQFDIARRMIEAIPDPQDNWSRKSKAVYYLVKGDLAYDDSNLEIADVAYRLVLELEPFNSAALHKLAQLYIDSGRPEDSIYLLERLETQEGYEFSALMLRSQLLIEAERYEESLPLLKRALRLRPSDALSDLLDQISHLVEAEREIG